MRAVLMSSVLGAMVFTAAVAQAGPTTRQEVKVPFAFTINGQQMPAGTYSVRQDDAQPSALLIKGEHSSAFVLTAPVANGSAQQDTSLVFEKDGNSYRLSEVWDNDGDGVSVLEFK